jgi:predicted MFS family arabinose efflux permease
VRKATTGVALIFFANGFVIASWLPRLPEIRDGLGVDLGTLGLALGLGGLGALLGSSLSGVILGKLGSRRSAVLGSIALFATLPLIAVASNAATFAVVVAVFSFLDAQTDVGMNAVGVRVEEQVGRSIMTRLHGLWSLGTLVGSGVSVLAVSAGIGLLQHLMAASLAGLIVVGFASRLVPSAPVRKRVGDRSGKVAIGLMLAGATAVMIEGAPLDWGAIFLADVAGASAAAAGTGFIVFTAGMLIGRMGGDFVVDRLSGYRTLVAGITLAVASMLLVITSDGMPLALIGFGLWGLGISVALPVLYKIAGSHRSFAEGAGLAALTVGTRLGFMMAPVIIGSLADRIGLPAALAWVVTLAAAASLVALRVTLAAPSPRADSLPGTVDS